METRDEIQAAMARAFFASAWADACEEAGEASRLSGCEIMDVMPDDIDPAALSAAESLANQIEAMNGKSLADLLAFIETNAAGDREPSADLFGHYCAMQAMGHGVGLYDAFGKGIYDTIRIPYHEFGSCYLERDYFAADGEAEE